MIYPELSKIIIDSDFKVSLTLGPGLLEKCYHNALYDEFKAAGLSVYF